MATKSRLTRLALPALLSALVLPLSLPPAAAAGEDSWCCFRMTAHVRGSWTGDYGMNPQNSINGNEAMSFDWRSEEVLELVRHGNQHELIAVRRRSGARAAPGLFNGRAFSYTNLVWEGTPRRCENGQQSQSSGPRDARLDRSGRYVSVVPRGQVPPEVGRYWPNTRDFLQVLAGFSVVHRCAYGFGYNRMEGGAFQYFDEVYLKAPSPHRFKRASDKHASPSERKFEVATLDPWTTSLSPNHSASGELEAKVKFVGFPRKRLDEVVQKLRDIAAIQ